MFVMHLRFFFYTRDNNKKDVAQEVMYIVRAMIYIMLPRAILNMQQVS